MSKVTKKKPNEFLMMLMGSLQQQIPKYSQQIPSIEHVVPDQSQDVPQQ